MPDPLSALRSSAEHLRRVVNDLDAGQLDAPAFPSEWTIADVLSHLGSGAVILQQRLEDTLAERETQVDFSQAVWAEWDAKSSIAKRADGLLADQELVKRLGSLSDEERRRFRFNMGPINEDLNGFVGLRLNEHALHTWDIEVVLDPAAALSSEASEFIVDRLELIARFTGKARGVDRPVSVRTNAPRRDFALTLGPEAVSLSPISPIGPESQSDLELAAEAFIRLIYGRLDPDHTPALEGGEHLASLRRAFPGP